MIGRLDRRGSTTMELALALPAFLAVMMLLFNAGKVFLWRAGVQNGVGEAARAATLFPPRDNGQLLAAFRRGVFGVPTASIPTPTFTPGTSGGQAYVDIAVTYNPQVTFGFVDLRTVDVTYRRRAWRQAS